MALGVEGFPRGMLYDRRRRPHSATLVSLMLRSLCWTANAWALPWGLPARDGKLLGCRKLELVSCRACPSGRGPGWGWSGCSGRGRAPGTALLPGMVWWQPPCSRPGPRAPTGHVYWPGSSGVSIALKRGQLCPGGELGGQCWGGTGRHTGGSPGSRGLRQLCHPRRTNGCTRGVLSQSSDLVTVQGLRAGTGQGKGGGQREAGR